MRTTQFLYLKFPNISVKMLGVAPDSATAVEAVWQAFPARNR